MLLDFDLGFDVSSDIFSELCQQVGATFYGSLTGHLTSRSLWVTPDGSGVTLCCPGRSYNFAWGRSGGANGLSVGEHKDGVVRETWGDTY